MHVYTYIQENLLENYVTTYGKFHYHTLHLSHKKKRKKRKSLMCTFIQIDNILVNCLSRYIKKKVY